jgi:predicted HAD superfamily Cof-like phosphohydrolase
MNGFVTCDRSEVPHHLNTHSIRAEEEGPVCIEPIPIQESLDGPSTFFDDVKAFHVLFNLPLGTTPAFTSEDDVALRLKLIEEEHIELCLAHDARDIVEVADAIADLIYVACGMAVAYGIPLNEVWAEVQRSNMAKVGIDGKPIYREDGKVAKPEGWTPPDIASILRRHSA